MESALANPRRVSFSSWLRANRMAQRHGSTRVVDDAPPDQDTLAEYFIGLSLRDLRLGWVACVIDAAAEGATLGQITRALIVVARRLHGVSISVASGVIDADLVDAPAPAIPNRERKHRGTLLTDEQVRAVRVLRDRGFQLNEIADQMGLTYHIVWGICSGATYREVV